MPRRPMKKIKAGAPLAPGGIIIHERFRKLCVEKNLRTPLPKQYLHRPKQ